MYRVCTPRREFGDISACAALQWEARSHPIIRSGNGALGEMRTPDPRIRSPMLYPAELRARESFQWFSRTPNFLGTDQALKTTAENIFG